MKLTIEIDHLTPSQAATLEVMFRLHEFLGRAGGSRWVAYNADGDGNYHPRITIRHDGDDGYEPTLRIAEQVLDRKHEHLLRAIALDFDVVSVSMRKGSSHD